MKKRNIIKDVNSDGGIAQSVEQRNHNPCVGGSNPSLATIKEKTPEAQEFFCAQKLRFEAPTLSGAGGKKTFR